MDTRLSVITVDETPPTPALSSSPPTHHSMTLASASPTPRVVVSLTTAPSTTSPLAQSDQRTSITKSHNEIANGPNGIQKSPRGSVQASIKRVGSLNTVSSKDSGNNLVAGGASPANETKGLSKFLRRKLFGDRSKVGSTNSSMTNVEGGGSADVSPNHSVGSLKVGGGSAWFSRSASEVEGAGGDTGSDRASVNTNETSGRGAAVTLLMKMLSMSAGTAAMVEPRPVAPVVVEQPKIEVIETGGDADDEEQQEEEPAVLLEDTKVSQWNRADLKRLIKIENIINRMKDPVKGIKFKDKGSLLHKAVADSCSGAELVEWMMANCGLLEKFEAIKFCQTMMNQSYLISVEYEQYFKEDKQYIFQTPYLWISQPWSISKKDYVIYLRKRLAEDGYTPFGVSENEMKRKKKLSNLFSKETDEIRKTVKEHLAAINELSKPEKRAFKLMEWAFWDYHRPVDVHKLEVTMRPQEESRGSKTEAEYEATLNPEQLLSYLTKSLEFLNASVGLNRCKVSTAVRNLMHYEKLYRPLDPFLDPDYTKVNPFLVDNTSFWDNSKKALTKKDVRVWLNSLDDLLKDPRGVECFSEFLKTEFSLENLDFYLAVQNLEVHATHDEFVQAALKVYDEFVPVGSPRELNITSHCRKDLNRQFTECKRRLGIPTDIQQDPRASKYISPAAAEAMAAAVATEKALMTRQGSERLMSPVSANLPTISSPSIATSPGGASIVSTEVTFAVNWRLPPSVFRDAAEHILHLMAKDSYNRFINSEILGNHLSKLGLSRVLDEGDIDSLASTP